MRWQVLGHLLTSGPWTQSRKLSSAVALSAINGIAHGSAVVFLPQLNGIESAFLSILLLGLCTGSVGTTNGYRPIFISFIVPVLLPLATTWAFFTGTALNRLAELSTALLVLLFGAVLIATARDSYRMFRESFEIRQQQAKLNRQLRVALDDAEAANRAKTRFLASASHDLRQPMHTLTLFGAALALRPLDEGSRRIVNDMGTALQSLGAQLDALLDISKLDAGVVPVRPGVFFLVDFLQRIEFDCGPLAHRKGLGLTVDCPPNAVCKTDEALLARIVRNLVDNAIKYTPRGGISIRVESAGAKWSITIADTGTGIDEAEQHKVFEEFYQVGNPERDRSQGLGLGLSIVRRLSTLLDVGLRMKSAPGQGTEFVLSVPRSEKKAAAYPDAAYEPAMRPSVFGLCVLVLDDEESVRKGMQSLLEGLGAQVLLAGCTAEALELAKAARPDVVLADLRLRGDDTGINAIAQLRELHPRLPALLISGDIASDRLQDARSAGIALLHKPVAIETLCSAIEQTVRNGEDHDTRKRIVPSADV